MPTLDVVIPLYNEEKVLPELLERLQSVFFCGGTKFDTHILFVNDGSSDNSALLLNAFTQKCSASVLHLSRNFGHQAAVAAGMMNADADYVAIIDGDLQDPPELILAMIATLASGHDVVYGQRQTRKESLVKRIGYWGFYRLITFLSPFSIPLDAGDFCVMNRTVLEALKSLPETLRFSRVLRAWVGFRQVGYPYDRPRRPKGRSKYHFRDLYRLATDGMAAASTRPLAIVQVFAFLTSLAFLGCTGYLSMTYFRHGLSDSQHSTALLGSLISFIGWGNFITLYVFSAYLGRCYLEVKARPPYILKSIVGQRRGVGVAHAA